MAETFGEVLRSVREAAGLSLSALAARTRYDKSLISLIENGKRPPHPGFAQACDQALGTGPLLAMLVDEGDQMRRRVLLANVGAAVGAAGVLGAAALADTVRGGLLDAAGADRDWDAVVAGFNRRLVVDPSPQFGQAVLASLMVAKQQLTDLGKSPDRLKAVAELGQIYGLWLGNGGDTATARNWYRTSTVLADRSGHTPTRVYARGRAASRGIYEGMTVRETTDTAGEALSLSQAPSPGAVEAWSALVHVHGLTGNLAEGRRAVAGMADVAEQLPDAPAGPIQRMWSFRNYLEGRVGPLDTATAVHDQALAALRGLPVWFADAKVYYGLALVRAGDVEEGARYALAAVKGLGHDVRVVALGVSDLLATVPAGHRSDEVDELATFAHAGPGPWETLA